MAIETVVVTGGNGKIGRAILEDLAEHGYRTANVSRGSRADDVADAYCRADLLDAGEAYGALATTGADAVVHMGTIPAPTATPDHVCYESNVVTSWNVLEAADELGLDAVVLPSSINAMGAEYQAAPTEVQYLPVDEGHPLTPRDPYGLAKEAAERAGAGFGRRPDAPAVAAIRYPWVATSAELREAFVEADRTLAGDPDDLAAAGRATLFSYLHSDDAAAIARCAIEADLDDFETFWAVAADTTVDAPSERVADRYYPDAERHRSLSNRESLIATEKANTMLEWEPTHSWTDC